ncbi:hypothetical protein L1887_49886 [Cichorium endivia]|nr:hypothetical protein L1887_49886 [Cichorium endivia]
MKAVADEIAVSAAAAAAMASAGCSAMSVCTSLQHRPHSLAVHKAAPGALTAFHDLKISGRGSWAGLGDVRPFCLEEFRLELRQRRSTSPPTGRLACMSSKKKKKKKEEKQIGRNDDVRALHRPKPLFAKLAVCCLTRGRAPVTTGPKKGIPRFGESPTTRSLDPDYSLIFTKRCHRLFFGVGLPSCVYRNNQRLATPLTIAWKAQRHCRDRWHHRGRALAAHPHGPNDMPSVRSEPKPPLVLHPRCAPGVTSELDRRGARRASPLRSSHSPHSVHPIPAASFSSRARLDMGESSFSAQRCFDGRQWRSLSAPNPSVPASATVPP